MKTIKFAIPMVLLALFLLGETLFAQGSSTQIEVGYLRTGKIDVEGFQLSKETQIQLKGSGGLYDRLGNDLLFYAWIIDGKTREMVWSLLEEDSDRFNKYRQSGIFDFEKEITLPKGDYEVYYAAGLDNDLYDNDITLGEIINLIFNGDLNDNKRNDIKYSRFSMTLKGPENSFKKNNAYWDMDDFSDHALVSIIRAGNNEFIKKDFRVETDAELNIYGIFEQYDREQFDFAWIVNSKTLEKVWPDKETKYNSAGGGRKNKLVSEKLDFKKGDYTLYYISDDSHSYDKWNALPPNDPQSWGISIWADDKNKSKVSIIENTNPYVLQLAPAHNNDYLSQAFEVKKDMKVRVYSLGERSNDYDMADYGWIVNTDTHETIWKFRERNSEYAGGAEKNRMVNEEIELKKGNYIAYYVTDGSHAYRNWNSAPPLIPDLWGLSILGVNNANDFVLLDSSPNSEQNTLAQIIRVGDNVYTNQSFTLDRDSKIRIYAIGEGSGGNMHDVGWIKNQKTGKIVWEMTYRNTDPAGGASKNRLYDGTILLPKGEYTVYFETDGSHSYRDWNSSPPHDQEHYGISVYLAD